MADNIKPLCEWTVMEVKEYCAERRCEECQWGYEKEGAVGCRFVDFAPYAWDFIEPTGWTEQDIEDAKSIMKVFAWAESVIRYGNELQARANPQDGRICDVSNLLLPSLMPGELVKLKDIAECKSEG